MEIFLANWRLAAVAALFFVGIVSRRAGLAGEKQGRALLAFVFNIGLPILIFGALAGVELRREHALLPVTAICVSLAGWGAAAIVARRFGLPRTGEGAMVMCAMSLNNSMIYPFAALSLGAAAFSQLVAFDMGHALLVWTVTTVIACKYGGHADDIPVLLKRTLLASVSQVDDTVRTLLTELDSMESLLEVLHQKSISLRDPQAIASELDTIVRQSEESERVVREMEALLRADTAGLPIDVAGPTARPRARAIDTA